jgi:AraC-like DNA-binding protein
MPFRSTLLSNYPVIRSSDPEFVRDRLFAVYGANSFDVTGGKSKFAARTNHLQIGGVGLSYGDYAGDVSLGFGEGSFVRQIFNIDGAGRYVGGSRSGEIAMGSCTPALSAERPLKFDYKDQYRHLVLRIEFDALRRNLGTLLGQEITRKLVFDEAAIYPPVMNSLRRSIFLFASDFNARGNFFSDLAAAEHERMVIMKFLMYHQHSYSDHLLRQPLAATPSAVRIVEEFIEANWDKPIDIDAMSAIARISARSLFRQFKKERGYSPADFAKRIRLNRAREMLDNCSEDASVTQIALKCGFQNPGHFARDYRLAFGELPSETLKRSIRRAIS